MVQHKPFRRTHENRASNMTGMSFVDTELKREFRRNQKVQSPRMSRPEFHPIPVDVLSESTALQFGKGNVCFFPTTLQGETFPLRTL
jgi:hypothetical protein